MDPEVTTTECLLWDQASLKSPLVNVMNSNMGLGLQPRIRQEKACKNEDKFDSLVKLILKH